MLCTRSESSRWRVSMKQVSEIDWCVIVKSFESKSCNFKCNAFEDG